VTSTTNIGAVTFPPYLCIGYTTDLGVFPGDFLISDLCFWSTKDTSYAHYTANKAWYSPSEVTNKLRNVRIGLNGIRLHNAPLILTDYLQRQIRISNADGLLALDAAGKVIHDIPNAPVFSDMSYGGHMIWLQRTSTVELSSYLITDVAVAFSGSGSTTNIDISSYLPSGMNNAKGVILLATLGMYAAAGKVAVGTILSGFIRYSLVYNVAPLAGDSMVGRNMKAVVASQAMDDYISTEAIVPICWNAGIPYIVYRVSMAMSGMAAGNFQYGLNWQLYLRGLLV